MARVYDRNGSMFVMREGYMSLLESARGRTDLVKVITGVRRCGKSTLMDQFEMRLKEQGVPESAILHLDLESLGCRGITEGSQVLDMVESRLPQGLSYVLIDEVQRLNGWEDCLNRLGDADGLDVYVTGSNAFILSSELRTFLTGRVFEVCMLPLSFGEFLALNSPDAERDRQSRFMEYLVWGGMPAVDPSRGERFNRQLLQGMFGDIMYKDIATRLSDKVNLSKLRATASFLLHNIGNLSSVPKMARAAGIDYNSVEKYYAVDTGMRNAVLENAAGDDLSRPLENVVFLELLRRGYTVSVGRYRDSEVDFTAVRDGETELFQVAVSVMDDGTFERERRSLADMRNGYRKTILSLDAVRRDPGSGIRHLNVIDWLLSE